MRLQDLEYGRATLAKLYRIIFRLKSNLDFDLSEIWCIFMSLIEHAQNM